MLYIDIPYIYLQEDVEAGLRPAPADLVAQLIHSVKLQYAATSLLGTTIMSVKFSFLFFFRDLLKQQRKMLIWWWCTFVFLLPTTAILMFSNIIACPYSDERILGQFCFQSGSEASHNDIFQSSVRLPWLLLGRMESSKQQRFWTLYRMLCVGPTSQSTVPHILTAAVISIPVVLLWKVQITLRRKLALWGILCLSIVTVFTAIIRVAGGNIGHGQVDSAWAIFWDQAEAAIAIIVVSVSAFRALFVTHRASKQQSPAHRTSSSGSFWSKISKRHERMLAAPAPALNGGRTYIRHSPYCSGSFEGSQDMELPLQEQGIRVTHDISSDKISVLEVGNRSTLTFLQTDQHEPPKYSAESFV